MKVINKLFCQSANFRCSHRSISEQISTVSRNHDTTRILRMCIFGVRAASGNVFIHNCTRSNTNNNINSSRICLATFFVAVCFAVVCYSTSKGCNRFCIDLFSAVPGNVLAVFSTTMECSVLRMQLFCFQEAFRFLIYKVLRKTERGLQEVANSPQIVANKHILAYVCGLGFGIISGLFALVNILADAVCDIRFVQFSLLKNSFISK